MIQIDRDSLVLAIESWNDVDLSITAGPSDYLKWLDTIPIPDELRKFLAETALPTEIEIGVAYLFDFGRVKSYAAQHPGWLTHGFLPVGSSFNGDFVAIQFGASGQTEYLSHEHLSNNEDADPSDYFLEVAPSVGAFAQLAIDPRRCPIDYYGTIAK